MSSDKVVTFENPIIDTERDDNWPERSFSRSADVNALAWRLSPDGGFFSRYPADEYDMTVTLTRKIPPLPNGIETISPDSGRVFIKHDGNWHKFDGGNWTCNPGNLSTADDAWVRAHCVQIGQGFGDD